MWACVITPTVDMSVFFLFYNPHKKQSLISWSAVPYLGPSAAVRSARCTRRFGQSTLKCAHVNRAFDKMWGQSVKTTHKAKQRSTHPVVVGAIAKVLNLKVVHHTPCTCASAMGHGWRKTNGKARMRETTPIFKQESEHANVAAQFQWRHIVLKKRRFSRNI